MVGIVRGMDTAGTDRTRIGIAGTGRLGRQLAYWLARAGRAPVVIRSRGVAGAIAASELVTLGGGKAPRATTALAELAGNADIVFLAVPDGALGAVAAELAQSDLHGKAIVHSCGALPAAVVGAVAETGGVPACFHPIQAFSPLLPEVLRAGAPPTGQFHGIAVGIEASDPVYATLAELARLLGATPMHISGDPTQRALYHAAAVVASNAMVGMLDFGIELMELAGVEPKYGRVALLPLMGGTLANLVQLPPGLALTGPVARGDAVTIEAHLEALSNHPAQQALYSNLTARLLMLAVTSGRIDTDRAAAISEVLLRRLRADE